MVSDSDLPYFRGYSRQRGGGFGELAHSIGRTAIPFLRRYFVRAAKRENNEGILARHGYELEKEPSDFEESSFIDREEELLLKNGTTYYGKLPIDLFQCEKLLLPNTKIRLKLIRARPSFYIISYNPHVSLKVPDCSFFTRRVVVNEVYHQTIKYQLTHQLACYNFMETIARTFIIPSGQNQFIQENVFNNAPIRR